MSTLFEISDSLRAFQVELEEILERTEGEVSPELEAWMDSHLAGLMGDRDNKLDNYGRLIRECELLAAARKEEAERLLKGAAVKENLARRLKERLKYFMETQGEKRIETGTFRFTVAKNGGKTPLEVTVPAEDLPIELVNYHITPDTDAIRNKLEQGTEIPGCRLLPRGSHLRIS